jgi:hypothetical protein
MAQPDVRATVVAGPLANVSVAYKNKNYIGDRVFPIIDKVPPRALISVYNKGAWFRDEAGVRGPGARANRGGFPTSTVTVAPVEYAFAKEVTDEDRVAARTQGAMPMQPEQDSVEFAADKIDLRKERLVRDLIVGTTWADGNVGGEDAEGLWAPSGSNTFLADIRKATKAIHAASGVRPTKLALDLGTFLGLKEEATVLDKIKYTERGVLTVDLLAALLELDEVLVGDAVYSSAKENKAGSDFTAVNVWDTTATKGLGFLFFAPPRPGLKTPSAGYQARCAYDDGLARRTTMWREPAEHQDVYEVAEQTHIVAVGAGLGYLFKDTLLT